MKKLTTLLFYLSIDSVLFIAFMLCEGGTSPVSASDELIMPHDFTANVSSSYNSASSFTLERRMECKKIIERIFWETRTWPVANKTPKPSFESVLPDEIIKAMAEDDIRKSAALAHYWNRPVTGEQLQAEIERMAKHTQRPELLKKVWSALDNDAFLIAECMARPILAERLIKNWYAAEQRFHGTLRSRAEKELIQFGHPELMKRMSGEYSETEWVRAAEGKDRAKIESQTSARVLKENEWTELIQKLSMETGQPGEEKSMDTKMLPVWTISSLQENRDSFYAVSVLEKSNDRIKIASVTWKKEPFDSWWSKIKNELSVTLTPDTYQYSLPVIGGDPCIYDDWVTIAGPPYQRTYHTAVWTGNEMIIWGGESSNHKMNTGGIYNPVTDSWSFPSVKNDAPSARSKHTAVWTGTEMIIWGGEDEGGALNTGGRYNPVSNFWIPTSTVNAPTARSGHTAMWTGTEMIIWGGGLTNTGARYNPTADEWTAVSLTNAPSPRDLHTAVWTGDQMIIWGGRNGTALQTGARYFPDTDTWYQLPSTNAPSARYQHSAVWTGSKMIIWGGLNFPNYFNSGEAYDPAQDSWEVISPSPLTGRYAHTAVWTGLEMIIWGGHVSSGYDNSGSRYNPANDSWSVVSGINAPSERGFHTAVWSGTEMIIWGGTFGSSTGGRYNPSTNSWIPTSLNNAPEDGGPAVWTGVEMIIWGGESDYGYINTGGKYYPATDSWLDTAILNAPSGRYYHTAVWSGLEMIIWGGSIGKTVLNTGGKYSPLTDSWIPTSTDNAPDARRYHTAVWADDEMIIWGGSSSNLLNTGGKYDPIADTWVPTSTTNAPVPRCFHTAAWSGEEMIIWGGIDSSPSGKTNTGGLYKPLTNSWKATPLKNAPEARIYHTAVWADDVMMIWGGEGLFGSYYLNTGSKYYPRLNAWTDIPITGAPSPRNEHTAVWNGFEMIIFGGTDVDSSGGKYAPGTNQWTPTSLINAPPPRSTFTAVQTQNEMIVWGGSPFGARYCAQCSIDPPEEVIAIPTAPNQITVSWTAAPDAIAYNVYKKYDGCGQQMIEWIGHSIVGLSLIDNDVQGGKGYYYTVTAINENLCESQYSGWISCIATGTCKMIPCSLTTPAVINNQTSTCSLTIQWDAALPECMDYLDLTYTIYKSTDPYFIPDATNQLATCITTTSYTDYDVSAGTTWYYIVRAEDSSTGNGGPCNGGNLSTNLNRTFGSPTGAVTVLFSDDFENGFLKWDSLFWGMSNIFSHSGFYSAHAGMYEESRCSSLINKESFYLPTGMLPKLKFWTRMKLTQADSAGILKGSSDRITWDKLEVIPPYPEVVGSGVYDCLGANQPAFTGDHPQWTEYVADLSAYQGENFSARFEFSQITCVYPDCNWYIDDVSIEVAEMCNNNSGDCTYSPVFAGLQSATGDSSSTCIINLSWKSAASACSQYPEITYAIYRSTNPDFEPSPYNLIASCISGTSYSDTNVVSGITYYYIVRAEDSSSYGNGPCNSGNTDSNMYRKAALALGVSAVLFSDGFESGLDNWEISANWNQSSNNAHAGSYSAFSGNTYFSQCDTMSLASFISLPAVPHLFLSFWSSFQMHPPDNAMTVLITQDNYTWTTLELVPEYNFNLLAFCTLNIEPCLSGNKSAWNQYYADLSAYAGHNVKIRFLYWLSQPPLIGAYIDDVTILEMGACTTGPVAPGTVPDNDDYPGIPLTIAKSGANLVLNWSAPGGSCLTNDYSIYRGSLPWAGYDHASIACSTGGATNATIPADQDSYYYLIVAQNTSKEGSYGLSSDGSQRPTSTTPCFTQELGSCN